MPFPIYVLITLIVVGVLLWVEQTFIAPYMNATIQGFFVNVVLVCTILWLLVVFLSWVGWMPGNYHTYPFGVR